MIGELSLSTNPEIQQNVLRLSVKSQGNWFLSTFISHHGTAQVEEAIESPHFHKNPEALYAMPIKRTPKASSSQSLRTTAEVRNAMQQVHDLSSEDEMRDSGRVSSAFVILVQNGKSDITGKKKVPAYISVIDTKRKFE